MSHILNLRLVCVFMMWRPELTVDVSFSLSTLLWRTCGNMCVCACVVVHVCMCVERPEVSIGCHALAFYLIFEIVFLTEPGAHLLARGSWELPVSASSAGF